MTSVMFSRWSKNASPGWVFVGAMWPLVILSSPIVALILAVDAIVKKYGYKENEIHEFHGDYEQYK